MSNRKSVRKTRACRFCSCTDTQACPQGCAWVNETDDVCTACASSLYRVLYHVETDWPRDKRKPDPAITGATWSREDWLPFVPAPGHLISCINDDFRPVEEAYFNAAKPRALEVFFKFDDLDRKSLFQDMIRCGWSLDE